MSFTTIYNTIGVTGTYTNSTNYSGANDITVFQVNSSIDSFNNQSYVLGGGGSGGLYDSGDEINNWNLNGKSGQHGIYISSDGLLNSLTNKSIICGGGGGGASSLDYNTFTGIQGGNGGAGGGGFVTYPADTEDAPVGVAL